jgi:hypothetical protein
MPQEWRGLALAALVLVLVLIVCYMCVHLFKLRQPDACGEGFTSWVEYKPACGALWVGGRRGSCKGLTTGLMPSIESDPPISWAPCCGSLGVPPPVYQ